VGVRIGAATAWSGDRVAPASTLVERGELDYLFFESMSEATMSGAQIRITVDPTTPGYDPFLEQRLRPILKTCRERAIKIVSNQGWLDPAGAAAKAVDIAREEGLAGLRVAAIVPKPLLPQLESSGLRFVETGELVAEHLDAVVSAEAYLGAWEIVEALRGGADVVLTSRVTDASLVLAPLIHELGWSVDDWDNLARGVVVGHLIECATHVTGGNFVDPGYTQSTDLADLGHPIADVDNDSAIITKPPGTGGFVSTATCKAQLLWEVGDPRSYLNPDVVADFTDVSFEQAGPDRVAVLGGRGAPPPETLKALIGMREGFFSEEMVLYAGPGALDRARLAEEILRNRLTQLELHADDLRFDYVGVNAVHREASPALEYEPYEVALRVAVRAATRQEVEKVSAAVAPMAVSGPTGTGKWGTLGERIRPVIGMYSALVPREMVPSRVQYFDA
jgi:hypothetical protein